jgi:hypothetical protein
MNNPIAIFLLGGPGSGKDYLLKNVFTRFGVVEVHADQIVAGRSANLINEKMNLVINGCDSESKIRRIQDLLEGYRFDNIAVSVSNKVSRERNSSRDRSLTEDKRIAKWYKIEQLTKSLDETFVFNNSINLSKSTEMERLIFANQIEKLLERLINNGLVMIDAPVLDEGVEKSFRTFQEDSKKSSGLKGACWTGYEAIGMKVKNGKKVPNCVPVKEDINKLFAEAFEIGTDEYVKHAISMTPGQGDNYVQGNLEFSDEQEGGCSCGTEGSGGSVSACGGDCSCGGNSGDTGRRAKGKANEGKEEGSIDISPTLEKGKVNKRSGRKASARTPGQTGDLYVGGAGTAFYFGGVPAMSEAIEYHLDNNISLVENAFRPGSEMFFAMINEAKKQYAEGKYTPADEYEKELLESDIGEYVVIDGEKVPLDFPVPELNEESSDPTKGKGIGKPWREGGGGAVYVRTGEGKVRKVRFSQSGMTKRYNEPGRLKSFMARHHCLTNKDKTSASYWACRWPRFFSKSGQQWW